VRHNLCVPFRVRKNGGHLPEEPSIPAGMALTDAAQQAIDGFLASTALQPSMGEVDGVELVRVSDGQVSEHQGEPGVQLTWHQGEHRFGLLIPISRLAAESGGLDAVPFYLRLAIDEPHSPTPYGSRHWFSDLPSGPY
jgi:hypothetical protein